ncbi:hypothetical protein [Euzebya sp.]|uniref:hypothetical protein n=1 Tax=Euzebya sp. TaxID=1971409 RepID=UPI00351531BD
MIFRSADRTRRRLAALHAEIGDLRGRLSVLEEQVTFLVQVEADAETEAVVGDTPVHVREHRTARRDLQRAQRERDEVRRAIEQRVAEQDRLLEQLLE